MNCLYSKPIWLDLILLWFCISNLILNWRRCDYHQYFLCPTNGSWPLWAPTTIYSHQSAITDQFFNYRTRAKGTYWERNDPMLDDEMSLCVWYFLGSRKYPKQTGLPENKGATRSSPSLVDLGFWEINDSRWYPWPWRRINCSGYDPASW